MPAPFRLLALTAFALAVSLPAAASGDALIAAPSAEAAAPPLVPLLGNYSWDIPLVMGDYIAIPGGDSTTLGAMTIGVTPDNRGIVGGALYFYDATGKMVTQGINGSITYSSDDALFDGAPLATTTLTAYTLSNGPPRGSGSSHPHQATPTSDVITWAWTGPREGVLTVNGRTQKMAHVWSGAPTVQPIDYSGDWLLVGRREYTPTPPILPGRERSMSSVVALVRLARIATPAYTVQPNDLSGHPGWVYAPPPPPPPADAQSYSVTCVSQACARAPGFMWALFHAMGYSTDPLPPLSVVMFAPSGAGRLVLLSREASPPVLHYGIGEVARVYGDGQRILGRWRNIKVPGVETPSMSEFALFRVGPETLDSRFDFVPCWRINDPGFDCNPYRTPYPGQPRDN